MRSFIRLNAVLLILALASQVVAVQSSMLQDYVSSRSSVLSAPEEQKIAWRREWLEKISSSLADDPDQPHKAELLFHALTLANSLKEYPAAADFAEQVLSLQSSSSNRFRWSGEAGEAARNAYLQTGNTAYAESARKHLRNAIQPVLNADREVPATQLLATMSRIRYLAELQDGVSNDPVAAADLYRDGLELLSRVPPAQHALVSAKGWDSEFWLSSEMKQSAKGMQFERAQSSLQALQNLEHTKVPLSNYMLQLARVQFLEQADTFGFQSAIETYLKTSPSDSWTPFLIFVLADSLQESGRLVESFGYYSSLLRDYREVLENADADAVERGTSTLQSVVVNLALLSFQLGDLDGAKAYALQVLREYPESNSKPLITDLLRRIEAASARDLKTRVEFPTSSNIVASMPTLDGTASTTASSDSPAALNSFTEQRVADSQQLPSSGKWRRLGVLCFVVPCIAVAWLMFRSRKRKTDKNATN